MRPISIDEVKEILTHYNLEQLEEIFNECDRLMEEILN